MAIDEYGLHTIMSLYYDTKDFQFIQHSMDKPIYRKIQSKKMRQSLAKRVLDLGNQKESKWDCRERRLPVDYSTYECWLKDFYLRNNVDSNQINEEIFWLFKNSTQILTPQVLISMR